MVRVMGRLYPSSKAKPVEPHAPSGPAVTVRLADPTGFVRSPRWQRGAAREDRRVRRHP